MHDWDTFYFEHWDVENPGIEPTHEDYLDWLTARAEIAFPSL